MTGLQPAEKMSVLNNLQGQYLENLQKLDISRAP